MIKKLLHWITKCRHNWHYHSIIFPEKGITIRGRGCIKCLASEILPSPQDKKNKNDDNVIYIDFSKKNK